MLMTRHYRDLGSASDWLNQIFHAAQSIRNQKHYSDLGSDVFQYGISALASQTSYRGETTGGIVECRLFSQALQVPGGGTPHMKGVGMLIGNFE